MRDKIIGELSNCSQKKNKNESVLHDILMKKGASTDDKDKKFIAPKENNIWLIDDKFMGYSYVASDKAIAKAKVF